eukprot:1358756-Rhodomonas_salina.1
MDEKSSETCTDTDTETETETETETNPLSKTPRRPQRSTLFQRGHPPSSRDPLHSISTPLSTTQRQQADHDHAELRGRETCGRAAARHGTLSATAPPLSSRREHTARS